MASRARRRRRQRRTFDRRAALGVVAWAAALASAAVAAWSIQVARTRPALLAMADRLAHARPPRLDLAGRYVEAYVESRPEDARGFALKAEILAASASGPEGLLGAIDAGDRARRLDPGRQDVRRLLLDCYLRLRGFGTSRPHHETAARALIAGLAFDGPGGAEAHRLAARALAELAPEKDAAATDAAIAHFRRALEAEPGDVESARSLAGLLRDRKRDPSGAVAVLDALLRADPSAEARLARYRYWLSGDAEDRSGRAAAELADALERHPANVELRLAAASEAIRKRRADAARRHLDAIGRAGADDPRVWRARGQVGLIEEHADEAVDDWRRGLVLGGGGDAELAWRIAFVLLGLGRTRDAAPLIDRIDALDGDEPAPSTRYLRALLDLQEGRLLAAIDALSLLEVRGRPPLTSLVAYSLGRALEAAGDEAPALAAFGRAARERPRDPSIRLALVRALRRSRPAEAEAELRRALAADPGSPDLRVALARFDLEAQARRAADSRDWRAFEADAARAAEVAPAAAALALSRADFLDLTGRPEEALTLSAASVRLDRRSPLLWSALGRRLALRGEADEALLALERGSSPEAAGDRPEIRATRALVLASRGLRDEAKAALVGGLDRLPTPRRPDAWAALGDVLRAIGDGPGARSAYAEWARLLPENPAPQLFFLDSAIDEGGPEADRAARRALSALETAGAARGLHAQVGRALDLLRPPPGPESAADRAARLGRVGPTIAEVGRIAPGCRWIALLTGRLREAEGRPEEAFSAYEAALGRDGEHAAIRRLTRVAARSGDARLLSRLASIRPDLAGPARRLAALEALARGDVDRAADLAGEATDDGPWQARFLDLLGRTSAAEAALQAWALAGPGEPGPWLDLIAYQARIGRPEAARSAAAEAASRVRARRPLLFSAACRLRAGDGDAAAVEFEEALGLHPDDPEAAVEAAEGLLGLGRGDRAEVALRRAIEGRPRPRKAARMLALLVADRAGSDRPARDEALALIGPESGDDGAEDRLARDLVLARVGDEPGRAVASARAARRLAGLPAVAGALRRFRGAPFAEARALGADEGGSASDRLRFAAEVLEGEAARDPIGPGRPVEEAAIRSAAGALGSSSTPFGDPDFLDRLARDLSGEPGRSARFLVARAALLDGLGLRGEAAADREAAAGRARARPPGDGPGPESAAEGPEQP